jgi:hypothetical protein
MFPGVLVDDGGAADYVPKADIKIRRIKEIYRAVKNGLPWKLPVNLVKYLVSYVVGRINIRRTTLLSTNMSPYRLFTGTKINYKKSLSLGFGDYCKVFNGIDNTSRRTLPCIALHPCNNLTGSWQFLNITSGMMIRRSNWRRMVMTQAVMDQMNAMQSAPIQEELPGVEPGMAEKTTTQQVPIVQDDQIKEQSIPEEPIEVQSEDPENLDSLLSEPVGIATAPVRRSARIAGGIQPPQRYALLTKLQETTKKLEDVKERAKLDAIQKEILQIFEELKAVEPVMKPNIPKDAEILRFFVFLVEKFLANGEFDKIKARLVANGAQQKRELYPNKSSPTASIHAIFTCFTLVAYIGNYLVAKIDVKGAYIQTEITGSPIYMKLDKKLTSAVISILPNLQPYVTPEGNLYTKLLKALYGCIQSGQLWYAKNKKVLIREGYLPTPTDPCIFRCANDDKIYFLILYVDDILLFADMQEIERE